MKDTADPAVSFSYISIEMSMTKFSIKDVYMFD